MFIHLGGSIDRVFTSMVEAFMHVLKNLNHVFKLEKNG